MRHCVGLPALETYILILISTVFVNNIVMAKILGLCPFMGVSKKLETAIGMGLATTFVLTLASGASYLVNEYLLGPELFYLRTLSFIVVIAGIVQFTEMFIHKSSPVLYQVLGIYLPLITTNCAPCWAFHCSTCRHSTISSNRCSSAPAARSASPWC